MKNPGKTDPSLRIPWQKTWIAEHMQETVFIDTVDFDGDGIDEILVPHRQGKEAGRLSIFKSSDHKSWKQIELN